MTTRLQRAFAIFLVALLPTQALGQILPSLPSATPPRSQNATSSNVPGRKPPPAGSNEQADGVKFDKVSAKKGEDGRGFVFVLAEAGN